MRHTNPSTAATERAVDVPERHYPYYYDGGGGGVGGQNGFTTPWYYKPDFVVFDGMDGGFAKDEDEAGGDFPAVRPVSPAEYREQMNVLRQEQKPSRVVARAQSSANLWSRVTDHFGQYKALPETDVARTRAYVDGFVWSVIKEVQMRDLRFQGQLKNCDLSASCSGGGDGGLRIAETNEFGYVLELSKGNIDIGDLVVTNATLKSNKTKPPEEILGRSHFSLSFKEGVPKHWQRVTSPGRDGLLDHGASLRPQALLEDFRQALEGLSHFSGELHARVRGPDVVMYAELDRDLVLKSQLLTKHGLTALRRHQNANDYLIRISLALAIPVERKTPRTFWPLQGYGNRQLDLLIAKQNVTINKCHLVADGAFWRADFSRWHGHRIRQLTDNRGRRVCLLAIKNLRRHLGFSERNVDHLLRWYPLKLAFLSENAAHRDDQAWRPSSVDQRIHNMLHQIEQAAKPEGRLQDTNNTDDSKTMASAGAMGSPQLDEEEADPSWPSYEARRIRQFVEGVDAQYHRDGPLHFTLVLVTFVCHLVLFLFGAVYLGDSGALTADGCITDNDWPRGVRPLTYSLLHNILALVTLVAPLVGLVWVSVQTRRHHDVLYDMFRALYYVYMAAVFLGAILFILGIAVAARFNTTATCEHHTAVYALVIVAVLLSGLTCAVFVFHSVIFLTYSQGELNRYTWEFVFFDKIYNKLWPWTDSAKEDKPRVSVFVNGPDPTRNSSVDFSEDGTDGGQEGGQDWPGQRRPLSATSRSIRLSQFEPPDKGAPTRGGPLSPPPARDDYNQLPVAVIAYHSLQRPGRDPQQLGPAEDPSRHRNPQSVRSPVTSQPGSSNTLPRDYPRGSSQASNPDHRRAGTLPGRVSHRNPSSPRTDDEVFLTAPRHGTAPSGPGTRPQLPSSQTADVHGPSRGPSGSRPPSSGPNGSLWLPELDVLRQKRVAAPTYDREHDVYHM